MNIYAHDTEAFRLALGAHVAPPPSSIAGRIGQGLHGGVSVFQRNTLPKGCFAVDDGGTMRIGEYEQGALARAGIEPAPGSETTT